MKRRKFLQVTGAGSSFLGLGMIPGCTLSESQKAQNVKNLWEAFQEPPALARPFFRWWWNGNRVTREELFRELQVMKEAGAGGVEINPIVMPRNAPSVSGEVLTWLSEKWSSLVKDTAVKAKEMGMLTDLIVGTGWPFGGEFLSSEETVQGLRVSSQTLEGGQAVSLTLTTNLNEDKRIQQVMLLPKEATSLDEAVDLTESVDENGILKAQVPSGKHELFTVVWENKFREVMHGAPGGAGPVLDHFNKAAVEKYLQNMSSKMEEAWGANEKLGDHIRSLFCDSIELEGSNWTGDFLEAFETRRGYDLRPYLPFVLMKEEDAPEVFSETLKAVRYDHSLTLAEIFEERFILPYHQWCNDHGCQSRYQAYGHPWLYTHMIDGYLIPDIPEGDQWLFNGGWQPYCDVDQIRYAIWNKYTSSAAHLKGSKIVSTEAMTNTQGVFEASLEYIKQATDLNFATGINHLVLHGFNYSPQDAEFPGWVRYGTYYHEKNPWWPYVKHWMDYTARLSHLFQQGKTVSQLAILGPTADIWSSSGLDRNAFNLRPWYLHAIWQAASHNGYNSDYLSERVLADAEATEQGKMRCMEMEYDALLVCDVEHLPPEVAQKIASLAASGTTILFIGTAPQKAPGRVEENQHQAVQEAIEEAIQQGAQAVESPSDSLQANQQMLTDWTGKLLREYQVEPGIEISYPDFNLFTNQMKLPNSEWLFFFANMDREKSLVFEASFPQVGDKTPWKWDAETGKKWIYPLNGESNQPTSGIHLAPLESLVLIFSDKRKGERWVEQRISREVLKLEGPWEVALESAVEGEHQTLSLETLTDLSQLTGLAGFSGTATYRIDFTLAEAKANLLDLGRVEDIAEVTLDGQPLGSRWWGKKVFSLPEKLKKGSHTLEVTVANRLFNYCLSQEGNPAIDQWMRKRYDREPLPAGLLGPVRFLEQLG